MSLLYFTGFDRSDSPLDYGTSQSGSSIIAAGRFGSKCLQISGDGRWLRFTNIMPANPSEVFFSLVFNTTNLSTSGSIISFEDNTVAQVSITVSSSELISIRRGDRLGTVLYTVPNVAIIEDGRWYMIEGRIVFDNTAGIVQLKVNGALVADLSGLDTQVTANPSANGFTLVNGSGSQTWRYDGVHIADANGTVNNSWLGDRRVDTIRPNGAGDSAQGTSSTGGASVFTTIDETGTPNTTDYNTLVTVGNKDLFAMENLAPGGTIHGVKPVATALKTDAGACDLSLLIKSGATEAESGQKGLNVTNTVVEGAVYETNPDTTAAFTEAEVNAIQVGYKRAA